MNVQDEAALDVVSFVAGGCRFAVEAGLVRMQCGPDHDERARAVEALLGLPPATAGGRTLLMKRDGGDVAVRVHEPVELLRLRAGAIFPLPPLLAACNTLNGLRALAFAGTDLILLVHLLEK